MPSTIYHLVPQSYHQAQPIENPYVAATFAEEGFIHCTADLGTLVQVANAYFAQLAEPLVCYAINETKLISPVKYEPPIPVANSGIKPNSYTSEAIRFPHIYGPINRDAIIEIITLRRDDTNRWIV